MKKALLWLCLVTLVGLLALAAISRPPSEGEDTAVPVIVDNPESAVPVTVDGASSEGEYSESESVPYESGSLYRAAPQFARNRFTAFVAPIAADPDEEEPPSLVASTELPGVPYLITVIESLRVTPGVYADGQKVANIRFKVNRTASEAEVTLMIRGTEDPDTFDYLLDTDNNGFDNGSASGYGIHAAASFGSSALSAAPHLIVEVAVPLTAQVIFFDSHARRSRNDGTTFASGRVQSRFFSADGTVYHISDADVSIQADEELGLVTTSSAPYVPIRIETDVTNTVHLKKKGLVPVHIYSTSKFDAMTIDPNTVVLRDSKMDIDFPNDFYEVGAKPVKNNLRANSNGKKDLVLWFTVDDMVNQGGFTTASIDAVIAGESSTKGKVADKTPVRVLP